MKISQYPSNNSVPAISSAFDAIYSALVGVCKFDVVSGVTAGAGAAFSVSHKLGRKPEFFWAIPEATCAFIWTAADKQVTSASVLVATASAAAVPFVGVVASRFE